MKENSSNLKVPLTGAAPPGPPISVGLNIVRGSDNNLTESQMFIQKPV